MKIPVEISARHCHLCQKDLETLFGKDYQLKSLKKLSQSGQFASRETINIKTANGQLNNVRVLGPIRSETQIELSQTDARHLKINPPIRLSGDVKNSAGAELIGPKGNVKIKEGVIIASRHLHCDPASAQKLKLKNNQKISLETEGVRSVIFNNVIVRVNKKFSLAFHLDTDEANAALGHFSGLSQINKK